MVSNEQDPASAQRRRIRDGIRRSVIQMSHDTAHGLRRLTPSGVITFLVAGALAPIAVEAMEAGPLEAGVLAVAITQWGQVGSSYITEVLEKVVDRSRRASSDTKPGEAEMRSALIDELTERLDSGRQEADALRNEMADLLRHLSGIDLTITTAIHDSGQDILEALAAAFDTLAEDGLKDRQILDDINRSLADIQLQIIDQQAQRRRDGAEAQRSLRDTTALRTVLANLFRRLRPADANGGDEEGRKPSATPPGPRDSGDPARPEARAPASTTEPYRGLDSFQPADAAWFFGREQLTTNLIVHMARFLSGPSLVFVVGASGSGKSSLLNAGLRPALGNGAIAGSDAWPALRLTPGAKPVQRLAVRLAARIGVTAGAINDDLERNPGHLALILRQALLSQSAAADRGRRHRPRTPADLPPQAVVPPRMMLIVDQFEELFTLCADATQRRRFIEALYAAASVTDLDDDHTPPAMVVIGLRADFYAQCTADPTLAPLLRDHQFVVGPMTESELRAAIIKPALAADLQLEPGLVETLLRELGVAGTAPGEDHALPGNGQAFPPSGVPSPARPGDMRPACCHCYRTPCAAPGSDGKETS
ncbi:ATP-binding protein [Streptosporangiaceae bacterium NEAU-GS5]|nr:ATP-binding protein [Streptosporangiaceae bacterium NEAU-GS5]